MALTLGNVLVNPELNQIESHWKELRISVMARKVSNLKDLDLNTKDNFLYFFSLIVEKGETIT